MNRTEHLIKSSQSGDKTATETLMTENSGLIWSIVRRFQWRGVETDDLYQLGCLGFLKAVEGFDTSYGTQFSTYAVPKISGEIRRFLRDDGAVKVSRGIKERAYAIRQMRNQLFQALGREPTIQEISNHTGYTLEEIATAESATASIESIQQCSVESGFSLEDVLSTTESEEQMVERISLYQAIRQLPDKDSLVIHLRYFHGLTQDRVSKILGVSQVQVSRIEKRAIIQLREMMH